MKKILYYIVMSLILLGYSQFSAAQQLYGKWVVPITSGGSGESLLLTFQEPEITYSVLETPPDFGENNFCEFSGGGYYSNYDLSFYVVGQRFCNGTNFFDWIPTFEPYLLPEFQIIQKPGNPLQFYSFFTGDNISYNRRTDFHFCYNEINTENNQIQLSDIHSIRPGISLDGGIAFAITPEDYSPRYLYLASERNSSTTYSIYKAGLRRWTITSNGIEDELVIIDESNSLLDEYDFDAYNLELKVKDNDEIVIAWIHYVEYSAHDQSVSEIVVINNGLPHIFDLGLGRIGGIEFSNIDENILYASCTNGGIVAIDYTTYENTNLIDYVYSVAPDFDFGCTFLQTAPDGNIYGVSNNGRYLGKIMQSGSGIGEFIHEDVFTFPFFETVATFREFDGIKYYILPENSSVYSPLNVEALPVNVSCPEMTDGQVTIYVYSGTPDYSITCTLNNIPVTGFDYDPDEHTFYKNNLSEGVYDYTITDAIGTSKSGVFVIEPDDDYYDFKNTKFEVFNNRSLPDAELPLNTYSFEEGILVHAGATLTITGSVYEFGKNAEIIIEPGATLELVGTTLTNHEECHLMWQGIEVQGDKTKSQQPELIDMQWVQYQGRLSLHNSAIENAVEAVGLLTRDANGNVLWDSGTGGSVGAFDSRFTNNTKAVHFMPYQNHMPGSVAEIGNASYFSNCTFELNENYIPDYTFYKHVDLNMVKGIEFKGCTFTNTATSGVDTYNLGIAAYDAGFSVESRCTQYIEPCPEVYKDKSTFNGFYNGIRATSERPTDKTFIVTNSEFENNAIGIFVSMVNLSTIVDNTFKVGYSTPTKVYDECKGLVNSLGIDMQLAYGFAIENNTFVKPATSTGQGDFAGIRVYACPSDVDVIYNNTFDNLTYGNYAQGTNRQVAGNDFQGVEYQCSKNGESVFNWEDFMVTYIGEARDGMIKTDHGSPEIASGNTFSKSAHWHIHNEGTQKIDWYFCPTCTDEEPTLLYSPEDPTLIHPYPSVSANTCPEHYSGGGSVKLSANDLLVKELDFAQNLSDYNSVESLIESLKDGGDTYSELSDIQSAIPDDMWSLRSQLLGDSPHLTKEVLMAMSDRTDVFPDDVLFEILAANPDELSTDTLISYLENKENPLPDYMIDILKQLVGGVTYKTILLRERTDYFEAKTQAAQDILRSILNDSILDVALYRNWLDNLGGLNADKQLVASYFSEGDSSSAMALLNMIPSLYALQGDELAEFNDYQSLLLLQEGWKQSGKHLTELDSLDLVTLYDYAENSTGSARGTAQNILTYAENTHFCDCMHSDDSTNAKMGGASLGNSLNRIYGLEITATPNPARVYVAFNYQLPESKPEGIISISDMAGKEIQRFAVSGKQGQQVWDIRTIKSGVYLYTLISGGLQKTGKVVIN